MFDPDSVQPFRKYGLEKVDTPAHRELTLEAARQGMVRSVCVRGASSAARCLLEWQQRRHSIWQQLRGLLTFAPLDAGVGEE